MTEELTVQPDCQVTLHCSITLEDGTVAESTFEEDPIVVIMGNEDVLLKGLQLALYGLKVGDRESILIDPENAFGMREDEAIQVVPASDFPEDMTPEVGQIIAFAAPDGREVPGAITEVEGDQITVDFNHPLSGHELKFEAEILEIVPAADA